MEEKTAPAHHLLLPLTQVQQPCHPVRPTKILRASKDSKECVPTSNAQTQLSPPSWSRGGELGPLDCYQANQRDRILAVLYRLGGARACVERSSRVRIGGVIPRRCPQRLGHFQARRPRLRRLVCIKAIDCTICDLQYLGNPVLQWTREESLFRDEGQCYSCGTEVKPPTTESASGVPSLPSWSGCVHGSDSSYCTYPHPHVKHVTTARADQALCPCVFFSLHIYHCFKSKVQDDETKMV